MVDDESMIHHPSDSVRQMGSDVGGGGAAYRPMDQVEIDVINTEVLQSGIKALLNALMKGTRDLTRDLCISTNQKKTTHTRISRRYDDPRRI